MSWVGPGLRRSDFSQDGETSARPALNMSLRPGVALTNASQALSNDLNVHHIFARPTQLGLYASKFFQRACIVTSKNRTSKRAI